MESSSIGAITNGGLQRQVGRLCRVVEANPAQSIKENGLYVPIVVNGDGIVLDGHHRFRACQELDIEPRTEVRRFADPLMEKKFVIEANLKRRHLTDFQKAELGHLLEPIESELARRRQVELAGTRPNAKPDTLESNEPKVEQGRVKEIIAKKVGLSPTTYQRAKTIIEKAPEELKEKVRSGETSINGCSSPEERSLGPPVPVLAFAARFYMLSGSPFPFP